MNSRNRVLTHRRLGFAAGLIVAAGAILWFVYGGRGTIETENAYVKADKVSLSADVSGRIDEVAVQPNQSVRAGDVLLRLDDTPFKLAVAEARAHLAQVRNDVLAKQSEYAEEQAKLARAESDAKFYRRRLERNEKMGPAVVSESQMDEIHQQLRTAEADIAINQRSVSRLGAGLGGNPKLPLDQQADVQLAQAQLDNALYRLSRTVIVAPNDGTIANEVPQVGELAVADLPLLSMFENMSVWVEANLKETQLAAVRPGQRADVAVDAYPGYQWQARVESLSPASGAEIALIPPQNASGNWVKVVQRIPVRIALQHETGEPPLRAGMSADVRIDVSSDETVADTSKSTNRLVAEQR